MSHLTTCLILFSQLCLAQGGITPNKTIVDPTGVWDVYSPYQRDGIFSRWVFEQTGEWLQISTNLNYLDMADRLGELVNESNAVHFGNWSLKHDTISISVFQNQTGLKENIWTYLQTFKDGDLFLRALSQTPSDTINFSLKLLRDSTLSDYMLSH